MKQNKSLILFLALLLIASSCKESNLKNISELTPIDKKIDSVMSLMTLKEKIGQMTQINLTVIAKGPNKWASNDTMEIDFQKAKKAIVEYHVGSVLNTVNNLAQTPATWYSNISDIQKIAMDSTNIKIPVIYGIDAIHGATYTDGATMFPQQISTAATWNPQNAYNMAFVCAYETRASGIPWNFSPVLDLGIDPRFPRQFETFGEDPFMVGEMGKAMIEGFQGDDFSNPNNVIACVKHMIAGAEPLNGLNISPMDVSERTLYEIHLPPYKKAIDAGVYSIMAAHNELNGTPSHMHKGLMTDLFRNEWGFEGFFVSDWYDVKRIWSYHKVARNYKEASLFSVAAGMDMNMHGPDFYDYVVALVKEKKLSMDRVDEACSKILYAKFQLGLFENRFVDTSKIVENVFIRSHLDKAEEIADNSITLLKNNDLLPINNSNSKRILVTGPNANNNTTLGDWHFEQPSENVVTIFEGIKEIGEKYNHKVDYFDSGIKIRNIQVSKITATSEMSANYDHVFVVVGDNSLRYNWEGGKSFEKTAGENKARSFLGLPGKQLDLVKAIYEKNKNMTVVYVSGKPISEPWIEDNIKSIIHAWEPGSMGGKSLGKIVFGMINPSGKMPITTARSVGQLIMVYNHKPTNYIHKYAFEKTKPLYPFGYGLSYTTFSISEPTLSTSVWDGSGKVHVEVDVKNTGEREGMETVQLYIRDVFSSVTRPVLELKGYKKVNVAPGETKRVSFSLALGDFAFYDREMKYKAEEGDFNIFVGNSSNLVKLKKTTLELTKNIYINEN